MHLIKTVWFGKIGIVVGKDEITKKKKAYIGVGSGDDEFFDIDTIRRNGTKVHIQILQDLVEAMRDET